MSRQYVPWVGIRDPFYKDQERQHQVQLRRIDNRTRGGIPVCAEKHPSHGNKVLGGNDGKGHNETTPVVKTGVGDVLQISSCVNSDSTLGDCRTGELAVIEIRIESVLCEQLLMGALFNDRTMVHDKDVVRISDGRETMSDDEAGPASHQLCHCFLDTYFRSGIDAACSFIENQNGWICQDHTSDGQQLLLTSRDIGGLFIEDGIVSFGQTPDEVIGMRSLGGSHDLLLRSVVAPVGNILTDRAVEEPGILQDHT